MKMQSSTRTHRTAPMWMAVALATLSFAGCADNDPARATHEGSEIAAEDPTTPGCSGGTCGDGTVNLGEQCDPPDGVTCDTSCQLIPTTCGDCVVGAGEACDPPDGVLCDASCQLIVVVVPTCGDGTINQPSEACEPPDGTTCDASCQPIPTGPTCGDGTINQPSEACEPPGRPASEFVPACSASCELTGLSLCASCEAAKCDAFFGSPGAWGCAGLTGTALSSCVALVDCIRATDCAVATHDAQACYCGSAGDLACLTGQANGACLAEYQAAAGTTDAGTIAGLFTDPSSPVGLANNQITCDADASETTTCTAVCPL